MKKVISLLLSLIMILTLLPINILADTTPTFSVESTWAKPGSTVNVDVTVKDNPGLISANLEFTLPDGLSIVGATAGDAFSALTMTAPSELTEDGSVTGKCTFIWSTSDINDEDIKDGVVLSLQIKIADDATVDNVLDISVSAPSDYFYGKDINEIPVSTENGSISVIDYLPGDVTADGKINTKDVIYILRYIVDGCKTNPNGYNVSLKEEAADVTADGKINTKDVIYILRYIVDGCKTNPNGYNIKLLPGYKTCAHSDMQHVEAKAATCTEKGNIEYWYCSDCDKYFTDAAGKGRVEVKDTDITALGHDVVIDEAVPATSTSTGLTEGSHCARCNKVLVEQIVIPIPEPEEYAITYEIADDTDTYLAQQTIENPNPNTYKTGSAVTLQKLVVPGYDWVGWYDEDGNKVERISADSTGAVSLKAKLTPHAYTLQFTVSIEGLDTLEKDKVKDTTYYVNAKTALPNLTMDKYIFVGWTDEDGNLYKTNDINVIPQGTTGDLILKDNWVSVRNLASAKTKLDDPLVVEDTDNKRIYFTYEIGTISNVPLETLVTLESANGLISYKEFTKETSLTSETMEKIGSTLSKETTDSTQFTLSKELTDMTELSEKYSEQNGFDRQTIDTQSRSKTNTQSISTSQGGSSENYVYNDVKTKDSKNENYVLNTNFDTGASNELTLGAKNTTEASAGVEFPIDILSVNAGVKNTTELSATNTTKAYMDFSVGTTSTWNRDSSLETQQTNSSTSTKNWNTTSAASTASTVSNTSSISEAIHELISSEYGYGKTYSEKNGNSEMRGTTSSAGETTSKDYAITFSTETITTEKTSYSTTGYTTGSYRLIVAGTLHVFAVVGYDIANNEYFNYTFSVLGDGSCNDGPTDIIDYSFDGTFSDRENSVIPFEVPAYVNEYVDSRIAKTDGLEYSYDNKNHTATVEAYTGTDSVVYVPSFCVDAEGTAYTVTGITSDVFKGNTSIQAVSLGRYVSEIPDSAFSGCTSLKYVICPAVTKIGNNAFNGCTAMEEFKLSKQITSLGENAFAGVKSVIAEIGYSEEAEDLTAELANSIELAENAASCGAKSVSLDVSALPSDAKVDLVVNSGDSFTLSGGGKTFTALTLESRATNTRIEKITFADTAKYPLKLYSDNVTLYSIDIENCKSFALLLGNSKTNLLLSGTNNITTAGENAIICKDVVISYTNSGKLNVSGNVLTCGSISGETTRLVVNPGEIKTISTELFDKYEKGIINITLDPNGGALADGDSSAMTAFFGTAIGELPTPTRDGFTFDGWYTEAESGDKVTEDYIFSTVGDVKIYAHWTANGYTVKWNNATGVVIAVERTSSPYANQLTGALTSGAAVYYGDVLSVKYTASTGYTIGKTGVESITVVGNVTSSDIYASATPNSYTYNIVYKSSNGTNLGTATATYKYGTTNTISPPAKTGYNSPSAQTVKWDSVTAKTITFTYTPKSVSTSQQAASGQWWWYNNSTGITFSVQAQYQNRTASSVQVRLVWNQTITKNSYYGYKQLFYASCGGQNTGNVTICENTTWASSSSSARTVTAYSGWMTVPVSATQTSVTIACDWLTYGTSDKGSWSKTISIPTY